MWVLDEWWQKPFNWLLEKIQDRVGHWIVAAMSWMGLTWVTQENITDWVMNELMSMTQGISGDALEWVAMLKLDVAITIIFSAYSIKVGLQVSRVFLGRILGGVVGAGMH